MGTVYLLSEWNVTDSVMRYKIGITKNSVEKRVKQLSTGNSSEIIILRKYESVEYKKIEKMLHNQFSTKRSKGEWFILDDDDVFSFIDKCTEAEDLIKFLRENNSFYK